MKSNLNTAQCPGNPNPTGKAQDVVFWIGTIQTRGYVSYIRKVHTSHKYFLNLMTKKGKDLKME